MHQGEQHHSVAGIALQRIFEVIREFKGYFVLTDEHGEHYVLIRKDDFEHSVFSHTEVQLSLPTAPVSVNLQSFGERRGTADDVLERINREIATYHLQQSEEEIVEPEHDISSAFSRSTGQPAATLIAPPRHVRFEPLRGDLPPELQE